MALNFAARETFYVSIPFIAGQWSLLVDGVVLGESGKPVSIPFIAGQWSLPRIVVTIQTPPRAPVSIPFIAGQWSLLPLSPSKLTTLLAFQSPSLRGSGRFDNRCTRRRRRRDVSIPFIAGQWSLRFFAAAALLVAATSQSPSLRGSGRFMESGSP